jgi:hypothetical protein
MLERIKSWIGEHPYLASTLVVLLIVALYLIFRGGSSSSGATAISPNPGGLSDAAYAAQLQANTQQAGVAAAAQGQQDQTAAALTAALANSSAQSQQVAAARDVALAQTTFGSQTAEYTASAQLQAAQAADAAAVAETNTTTTGGVQIAGINAGAQVQVAGIQADVSKTNIAAQLAGLEDTNKTSIALGGLAAGVATTQANDALIAQQGQIQLGADKVYADQAVEQGQIQLGVDQIYATQESTDLQTKTAGAIAAGQTAVQASMVNDQYQTNLAVINSANQIPGSVNRVAVLDAVVGSPGAVPAAIGAGATATANGSSGAGILNGIANLVGSVGKGVVAGLTGVGSGTPVNMSPTVNPISYVTQGS